MVIDNVDKRILFELDLNARQSVKQLAKKLNINRDTLAYRIKQLEKNQIIQGYYTVIDYSKFDLHLIRLYLKLQNMTKEIEDEIVEQFIPNKKIFTLFKTQGHCDLVVGFFVKELKEFYDIYLNFKKKYKKYINSDSISYFIEYYHYAQNYLVDEQYKNLEVIKVGSSKDKVHINEVDKQLLLILSDNAKISLVKLGEKLNLTSMAVLYRIKELEKKGVIKAYKALINYSVLGYQYYKIDLEIDDLTSLDKLKKYAKFHQNIIFEDITIGGGDFQFNVRVKGEDELYLLFEDFKKEFSGLIRTYKYYKAQKIYKYIYFPDY